MLCQALRGSKCRYLMKWCVIFIRVCMGLRCTHRKAWHWLYISTGRFLRFDEPKLAQLQRGSSGTWCEVKPLYLLEISLSPHVACLPMLHVCPWLSSLHIEGGGDKQGKTVNMHRQVIAMAIVLTFAHGAWRCYIASNQANHILAAPALKQKG